MRTIWIVDDDEREAQFVAAVLEYETGAAGVLVSPTRFVRRVGRGDLPDALLIDEGTIRLVSPGLRESMYLIDRLVIVGSRLYKADSEAGGHPRGARRLRRPLLHKHLVRAMNWLDRYTDDDSWSSPQAADATTDLLDVAGSTSERRRLAAAMDRNEDAEWEATGQWSPEYE